MEKDNDQKQIYRDYIKRWVDEIQDLNDLKRIYTLVSVKHEKVL